MPNRPKIHIDSFEEYRISVLRRIEWMLNRHFRDVKRITMRDIKKAQLELNAYENFKHLVPAKEKQILVLDDGSKDKTAEVARKNKAIVFSHQYNRGLAETFKTEIKEVE